MNTKNLRNVVDNFRQEILWTLSTSSSYELVMRCWPTSDYFHHNTPIFQSRTILCSHNPTFFGRYVGYLTDHPSCLILLNYSNILTIASKFYRHEERRGGGSGGSGGDGGGLSCTEERCWVTVHSVSGGVQLPDPTNCRHHQPHNLPPGYGEGGNQLNTFPGFYCCQFLFLAKCPPAIVIFCRHPAPWCGVVISVSFGIIQVWLCRGGGGHHHNYPDTHHLYLRTSDIYLHFLAGLENCTNPASQR